MNSPTSLPLSSLPAECYIFVAGGQPGKQIGIIRRGEAGYYLTDYAEKNPVLAADLVRRLNRRLGVGLLQAEAMQVGSMFGWDAPGVQVALDNIRRLPDALSAIRTEIAETNNGKLLLANVPRNFTWAIDALVDEKKLARTRFFHFGDAIGLPD